MEITLWEWWVRELNDIADAFQCADEPPSAKGLWAAGLLQKEA